MNETGIAESLVEEAILSWLASLGYTFIFGPDIAPEEPAAERESFQEVLLICRLGEALSRLNPSIPADALEEALKQAGRPVTFYRYSGTGHWFFEPDRPQAYDHAAASLAWERTLAFLKRPAGA